MVGFPGETDSDFKASLDFVRTVGFLKCHVFNYSKRNMTKAATLIQVAESVKKERMYQMLEVTNSIRHNILMNQIGETEEIIVENRRESGYIAGYTKRYIPVKVKENLPVGDMKSVEIFEVVDDFCIARVHGIDS